VFKCLTYLPLTISLRRKLLIEGVGGIVRMLTGGGSKSNNDSHAKMPPTPQIPMKSKQFLPELNRCDSICLKLREGKQ
jgi:hypothetical protein